MSNEPMNDAAEANRLYWDDVASVSEIANRLGISRRALYEIIEPRPSGAFCGTCGVEAVFINRSAVASRTARCPRCSSDVHADILDMSGDVPHSARSKADVQAATAGRARFGRKAAFGAALLGVVAGCIATLLVLNRD